MNVFLIFFNVIFPNEYNWIQTYIDNDTIWLESAVNWEEAFDLILTDFTIYNLFVTPFFFNSHFFLDTHVKLSFIDILFIVETNKITFSKEFYDLFVWDVLSAFSIKFFSLQFLFYTDYQDLILIMTYYSPELIIALNDFIDIYWVNSVLSWTPAVVFDSFHDALNATISEFFENIALFFFFVWAVALFINTFNLLCDYQWLIHINESACFRLVMT